MKEKTGNMLSFALLRPSAAAVCVWFHRKMLACLSIRLMRNCCFVAANIDATYPHSPKYHTEQRSATPRLGRAPSLTPANMHFLRTSVSDIESLARNQRHTYSGIAAKPAS